MAYDNQDKIDLLWKRYRGVTPTSPTKSAQNESLISIPPTFQQNFWTDSDRIPLPAPTVVTPTGNELWFEIVSPRKGSQAVEMLADPTTNLTAFHAMTNPTTGIVEANRISNWVPPVFHPSYTIDVWAGNPNSPEGGVRLTPLADGAEWEFDYSTGVLFFPNGVPPIVEQTGIWIEGWVYTGEIGRGGQAGNGNTSKIRTLTFTSGLIAPGASVDFTLDTGGKCTLVEAKVTVASTLECHALSARTDTNPYRFIAIVGHLVDDGSYVIGGTRYFGERFVQLINMEDTTSSETYWRLKNDSPTTQSITVIIRVA